MVSVGEGAVGGEVCWKRPRISRGLGATGEPGAKFVTSPFNSLAITI
jgi:hypothetical protein